MKDFTGYWAKDKTVLKGINLEVKKGDLVGICGRVGSGKSSLLLSIIGEMPFYRG
jgi:ABC-type lipoprotein export system ATPase subunit